MNNTTASLLICLDSHKAWYDAAMTQAELETETAHQCDQVKDGVWTVEEARRFLLADALRDWMEDEFDDLPVKRWQDAAVATLVADAMANVNWNHVACHYLTKVEEAKASA